MWGSGYGVVKVVVPLPGWYPDSLTVASAHHVPTWRVVNVNVTSPFAPVVAVPVATGVPEHVVPEKTTSRAVAPATGTVDPEEEVVASTVRGTW